MTDSSRWKATVYVGGLGPQVTAAHVHDAFLPFGDIADVTLPTSDRQARDPADRGAQDVADGAAAAAAASGHRGFAYVEYEDVDDAKEAIDNMDKSEFFGRIIKVTAAKPPKSATDGLESKKALWHQEAWLEKNAVGEEDRLAVEQAPGANGDAPADPMQGLEGLDVAGPRPE